MQLSYLVTRGAHVTAGCAEICGRNACPAAHLHQVEIHKRHVGGVGVSNNNI